MLIGRVSERQAIARALAAARIGESRALVLAGEAGVGKTALLLDALSRSAGFRVLRAVGIETERQIPFAGLLQLLRPALGALPGIPAPQAESLGAALALRPGTPGDRFAVGAATLSLVCRHAEEGPVAVVVDDLHLLDRPSAEAIVFAVRRLAADPVAVLLSLRPDESDLDLTFVDSLPVRGLDLDDARDLVEAGAAATVSDEQLRRLHRSTGGNPLALIALGADPAVLDMTSPDVPLPVPAAVTGAFARRLRQLDEDARCALLVAAVCGGDLALTTAASAALGSDPARLGDAQDQGLIQVRGGRLEFFHPLLRAAVYADASADDRRSAHRALAATLPASDTDRRAWHLSEAAWQPDEAVADLLDGAGRNALNRSAYAVAATAFERASRISARPAARLARLVRAADAAWAGGSADRATGLLDEAGADPPDARAEAQILELRAAIAARSGSLGEARAMLVRAAGLASHPDRQVALLADAVHVSFYLADAAAAASLAVRLEGLLTTRSSAEARALGMVATGIAKVLAGRGGLAELRAAEPLLQASTALREDPRHLPWLMLAPLFLRDADSGARLRELVDGVRGRVGIGTLPFLLFQVARDEATTDRWSRAEADYAEAIRLARDTGQTTELAMSLAGLAWLESRQGQETACRDHAAEALAICTDRGIHLGEAWVGYALGDLELSLGRPDMAAHLLTRLASLLGRRGLVDPDLSPGPELVDALARLGREREAEQTARDFLAAAERKGQPWARARGERALALVRPDREMVERFSRSLELHAQTLDRFETARTALAYGMRLRRAARRVEARPQLREAMTTFEALGARLWYDQAAGELDATGERVPPREPGGVASLTPQELQVSLLLAEGRTTREVAAALFLSPKTVEYHLRKVYTKLGIRSRTELAALVTTRGTSGSA